MGPDLGCTGLADVAELSGGEAALSLHLVMCVCGVCECACLPDGACARTHGERARGLLDVLHSTTAVRTRGFCCFLPAPSPFGFLVSYVCLCLGGSCALWAYADRWAIVLY